MKTLIEQRYAEFRQTITIPVDPFYALTITGQNGGHHRELNCQADRQTAPKPRRVRCATPAYDTRPREGEENIGTFKAREAAKLGVTKEAINYRIKQGLYPGIHIRKIHQNLSFVSFR